MGEVVIKRRDADVIDGALIGHITPDDVTKMHKLVVELLMAGGGKVVIIDTSALTTFSPAVRVPGVPFLQEIRKLGVVTLIALAPSPLVRMTAAAIALAAGLPMEFVKDKATAEASAKAALAASAAAGSRGVRRP